MSQIFRLFAQRKNSSNEIEYPFHGYYSRFLKRSKRDFIFQMLILTIKLSCAYKQDKAPAARKAAGNSNALCGLEVTVFDFRLRSPYNGVHAVILCFSIPPHPCGQPPGRPICTFYGTPPRPLHGSRLGGQSHRGFMCASYRKRWQKDCSRLLFACSADVGTWRIQLFAIFTY